MIFRTSCRRINITLVVNCSIIDLMRHPCLPINYRRVTKLIILLQILFWNDMRWCTVFLQLHSIYRLICYWLRSWIDRWSKSSIMTTSIWFVMTLHVWLSKLHHVLVLVAATTSPVRPIFRMSLHDETLLFVVFWWRVGSTIVNGALAFASTVQWRPDFRVIEFLYIIATATLV